MRRIARNGLVAALYAGIALALPATAMANYRLATALYVLAAWDPALIPGLALGNALAGLPNGLLDMALGGLVGVVTAWACSRMGRWAPVAVLVVPTLVVPVWLAWLYQVPYGLVVGVLVRGQAVSAVLAWLLLRAKGLRRMLS